MGKNESNQNDSCGRVRENVFHIADGNDDTCCPATNGAITSRRHFLRAAGLGFVSCRSLAGTVSVMAGPFGEGENKISHFVPADKKLHKQWVQSLYARGMQEVYSGRELETIGMPVGGIGAGQLYLCGDGTLGCWQIFNYHHFSGGGRELYKHRMPGKPVDQGFAVIVERAGRKSARRLNKKDMQRVEFIGQYPIGQVRYRDDRLPVAIEMEAFSPYIPLNAQESALPVTIFHIKMKNTSSQDIRVALAGWLENAVCCHSNKLVRAHRCNRIVEQRGRSMILHTAQQLPEDLPPEPREAIVLGDFEGDDFGGWQVAGKAFGTAPAADSLPGQPIKTANQKHGKYHISQCLRLFIGTVRRCGCSRALFLL
ncbi:MAG: hypothetical protein JSV03_16755, partial [Planctomycetota bacterium]